MLTLSLMTGELSMTTYPYAMLKVWCHFVMSAPVKVELLLSVVDIPDYSFGYYVVLLK
jgi:hypothetical protein